MLGKIKGTHMKRALVIGMLIPALLTGCKTWQNDGNYIGQRTGGLVHYPHEEFGATRQLERWYGWDWGKTSSAYPPGSPEYIRLRQQEVERLAAMGLDPMGRPLRD